MRFLGAPIDRAAALLRRSKSAELQNEASAKFLAVHSRKLLAKGNNLRFLTHQQVLELSTEADVVYLGPASEQLPSLKGAEVFVVDLGAANVLEEKAAALGYWRTGRELLTCPFCDDAEVTLAGMALAITDWHQSAKFDGRSGKPTTPVDGGAKRHVVGGHGKVYPRTDPVAIGLIVSPDGRRCLLGRSPKYPAGMYTCLSGFVDQCESVEEAFRREAFEEAGVRLGSVSLVKSQPWPVGRGGSCELMLACKAVAESEHINVNRQEIEDARWFSHQEVNQMLRQEHPKGLFVPPRYAIANALISDFAGTRQVYTPLMVLAFLSLLLAMAVISRSTSVPLARPLGPLALGLTLGLAAGFYLAKLRSRL